MPDPFIRDRPSELLTPPHSITLSGMRETISAEIAAIDWSQFTTAYNAPESVPLDLRLLLCGSEKQARDACHRLWCGLCHQHAYVSSAAEPAFRFLFLGLVESNDLIRVEILDIFLGFVVCRHPEIPFSMRLFERVKEERRFIEELKTSSNPEISEFSESICRGIDEDPPDSKQPK